MLGKYYIKGLLEDLTEMRW